LGFPPNVSLASFRKGGIANAGQAGATHAEIQAQTGHSSRVLDRYLVMNPEMLHAMHAKQAASFATQVPNFF
jgi:hypothetical protein